jgi:hypothetical protein
MRIHLMCLDVIPVEINAQTRALWYGDVAVFIHVFEFVGEFGWVDGRFGCFYQRMPSS